MLRNRVYRAVPKHLFSKGANGAEICPNAAWLVDFVFGEITEAMVQNGADVDIDLGGEDTLVIANITLDKLTAVDVAY